jgi:hypothetical protein
MGGEERLGQLAENMRFYGEMRFKQLTLFAGAMTVLGAALTTERSYTMLTPALSVRFAAALAGLLLTTVFWVMEVRSSLYWVAIREELQGQQFWPRPRTRFWGWLNATNAILVLHLASYGFWLLCARAWSWHPCVVLLCGMLWLAVLAAFTTSSYWHLWIHKESALAPNGSEAKKV